MFAGSGAYRFVSWLYFFGWQWWSHATEDKMLLFLVVVPMVGIVAGLLVERGRRRGAILWSETVLAVGLLGWSFRLTAAALLLVAAAYTAARKPSIAGPWRVALRVAFVALCLAPVEVSLRSGVGPAHFAPAVMGALTAGGMQAADRGEIFVVGGCTSIYNEPRWVWVW
jgi:hypothetical protein